jgi:hypothetical protein
LGVILRGDCHTFIRNDYCQAIGKSAGAAAHFSHAPATETPPWFGLASTEIPHGNENISGAVS